MHRLDSSIYKGKGSEECYLRSIDDVHVFKCQDDTTIKCWLHSNEIKNKIKIKLITFPTVMSILSVVMPKFQMVSTALINRSWSMKKSKE